MQSTRAYLVLVLVLGIAMCEAARRKRPNKMGGPMKQLEDRLEMLEEKLEAVDSTTGGCNKVNFLFHGDDHDDHHEDGSTNVHVHVHVDQEGGHHGHDHHEEHSHHAICVLSADGAQGEIHFTQEDHSLNFDVQIQDLTPNSSYMMHVHQNGDISNGCNNAGGHFDANPDDPVDEGDLGTFTDDGQGKIIESGTNSGLSLFGSHSVIGRALILHDSTGAKIACCVIGFSPEDEDHDHHDHDHDSHEEEEHDHAEDHHHDHADHADHDSHHHVRPNKRRPHRH